MQLFIEATPTDADGFHPPSVMDFFPPVFLFEDFTIPWLGGESPLFGINRVILLRFIALAALLILFWLGTRRMKLVPGRGQSIIELGLGFVRENIVYDMLGEKEGKKFLPLVTTIFFVVLFCNATAIIPGLNLAGTSVVGMPLVLALAAYIGFIWAGLRKHPGTFLKNSLAPSGVPPWLYPIVVPIEFLSTFVLRPATLTLRLMMNMFVGHILLVLLFSATHFFIFSAEGAFKAIGLGTFLGSIVFTLFEMLVIFLQAYVFAILTTVYIQLALAEDH